MLCLIIKFLLEVLFWYLYIWISQKNGIKMMNWCLRYEFCSLQDFPSLNSLWCTNSSRYAIEDSRSLDKCLVKTKIEVVQLIKVLHIHVLVSCSSLHTGTIKVFVKHPRFCNLWKTYRTCKYIINSDKQTVAAS